MGEGERAQWAMKRAVSPVSNARSALDLQHDEAERPLCGMKRGEGMASKGAVGVGFSPDAPRLLRCLPGRVGSRRDPTKQKTMQCMVFCFVRILVFTYSPEPSQPTREAHLTCNMTKPSARCAG